MENYKADYYDPETFEKSEIETKPDVELNELLEGTSTTTVATVRAAVVVSHPASPATIGYLSQCCHHGS